jgi:hypothetical protein
VGGSAGISRVSRGLGHSGTFCVGAGVCRSVCVFLPPPVTYQNSGASVTCAFVCRSVCRSVCVFLPPPVTYQNSAASVTCAVTLMGWPCALFYETGAAGRVCHCIIAEKTPEETFFFERGTATAAFACLRRVNRWPGIVAPTD